MHHLLFGMRLRTVDNLDDLILKVHVFLGEFVDDIDRINLSNDNLEFLLLYLVELFYDIERG